MFRESINYYITLIKFIVFCKRNKIDSNTMILFLADENITIDKIAVQKYPDLLKKRYFTKGVIVTNEIGKMDEENNNIKIVQISKKKIQSFYRLFCFYKYSSNVIFTYVNTPNGNALGEYIKRTDITEYDVVCFSLFRLEHV